MKRLFKQSIVITVSFTLIFSPLFASRASAQWVVYDPANFVVNSITATASLGTQVKEGGLTGGFGLDAIAWFVVNIVLERMAASVVNWINSGFQGKPTFLTDPDAYFKNIADGVAGQVIYNNPDFKFMCSPFKAQVQIALQRAYLQPRQFQCTLGDIANNWENFMEDFSSGGWEGYLQLTQNDQSNPLGLFQNWQEQIQSTTQQQQQQKQTQLNQGRGFLSIPQCSGGRVTSSEADKQYLDSGYRVGDCPGGETITTPGAVVENQLNSSLGVAQGRLQVADEINEIISALLNQLVNKALGGLSKLVKGKPQNGEKNYLNELENATQGELQQSQNIRTIPMKTVPSSSNGVTPISEGCPRGLCICPSLGVTYSLVHYPETNEWWCEATECPDGYAKDMINEQCISSNSIQTTITSGQGRISGAEGAGLNIINCQDTTCFSAAGGSRPGGRDGDSLPPGSTPPTGGSSTGNPPGRVQPPSLACGPAAGSYASTSESFSGDPCRPGAVVLGQQPVFPGVGGRADWTCINLSLNNATDQCTATRSSE